MHFRQMNQLSSQNLKKPDGHESEQIPNAGCRIPVLEQVRQKRGSFYLQKEQFVWQG